MKEKELEARVGKEKGSERGRGGSDRDMKKEKNLKTGRRGLWRGERKPNRNNLLL